VSVEQTMLEDHAGCGPVVDYDHALKRAFEELLEDGRHPTLTDCPRCGAHVDVVEGGLFDPAGYDCPQCEWEEPI
jgi:ssDNA-binding Zn-finger/Zn-ribbon topoisomerase 1